ncbi:MAG: FadR family transcriptional regulator [Acidobacteriia bacterium]|nr:FadR family transcriptional regulator [Terriglobia bacterium]
MVSSPTNAPQRGDGKSAWKGSAEQVVSFVRHLIERGQLCPGDRLSAERDLALQIGVSRPTVRVGLRALSAMGVVQSRHGSGTYITAGPPSLGSEPLNFQAALHGFTQEQMFEARRILEVGAAGLAAQRARPEAIAKIADEVSNLFAAIDEKDLFLVHDMSFHRAVAAASENPIVASLVEMVSTLFYERRKPTARLATETNLREAAQMHRLVYQAIRAHDPEAARSAMDKHLLISGEHHALEQSGMELKSALLPGTAWRGRNERSPRRGKGRQSRGDE